MKRPNSPASIRPEPSASSARQSECSRAVGKVSLFTARRGRDARCSARRRSAGGGAIGSLVEQRTRVRCIARSRWRRTLQLHPYEPLQLADGDLARPVLVHNLEELSARTSSSLARVTFASWRATLRPLRCSRSVLTAFPTRRLRSRASCMADIDDERASSRCARDSRLRASACSATASSAAALAASSETAAGLAASSETTIEFASKEETTLGETLLEHAKRQWRVHRNISAGATVRPAPEQGRDRALRRVVREEAHH
eukprot:3983634-Prymnesium_polylepis.2